MARAAEVYAVASLSIMSFACNDSSSSPTQPGPAVPPPPAPIVDELWTGPMKDPRQGVLTASIALKVQGAYITGAMKILTAEGGVRDQGEVRGTIDGSIYRWTFLNRDEMATCIVRAVLTGVRSGTTLIGWYDVTAGGRSCYSDTPFSGSFELRLKD